MRHVIWMAEREENLRLIKWLTTLPYFFENKQDTENLFTILKEFESFTGLKLNIKKKNNPKTRSTTSLFPKRT